MAEHHDTAPAELGAPMDYNEHERTYNLFLALSKWGAIICIALVAAMAFGFFAGGFSPLSFCLLLFVRLPGSFFKTRSTQRCSYTGRIILQKPLL